jgi:hypothetical protein
MGLKLQGILLNENLRERQSEIFEQLGIQEYKLIKQHTYSDYWDGFQERNKLVLSFYKNATIINCDNHFLSSEIVKKQLSKGRRAAGFFEYDVISAFSFDVFENGKPIRRMYSDSAANYYKLHEGEPLDFEKGLQSGEERFMKMAEAFLSCTLDNSILHDGAESFEYTFTYTYPNLFQRLLGNNAYHSYCKRTF